MKMEIRGRVFHGNILPLLWTFTPEFGTIVVVSLYTNEEILCTGSREKERVYVEEVPVAARHEGVMWLFMIPLMVG